MTSKEQRRKYYLDHREEIINRSLARAERRRTWLYNIFVHELGGCKQCGEQDPVILHAHHRDPSQKKFAVGGGLQRPKRIILEELAKCDILCANCHAREHERLRKEASNEQNMPKLQTREVERKLPSTMPKLPAQKQARMAEQQLSLFD